MPDGQLMARQHLRANRAAAARTAAPAATEAYFTGPTYFARTIDAGQTWQPARIIYDPGKNAQTIGNQVVVSTNQVLVFWSQIFADGQTKLRLARSSDFGATFGAPADAAMTFPSETGVVTPDKRSLVRDGSILFDVAMDPHDNARLYLVWQDSRWGKVDRIAFSQSSDAGATWSAPIAINKTPVSPAPLRNQAFVPSVEVDANSRVVVTYYDFRNDRPTSRATELTDYWSVACQPDEADCRSPAAWGNERRLTPSSFNMLNAPQAGGLFLGDYQGLVRQGSNIHAVYGIATGKRNQTSIVTTPIP